MQQKVYFAGELFSLKHLVGNALLADSLYRASEGRYASVLPQMLEQRETTEESVRNQDLRELMSADLGVFNFDGDEIDSGTVVEYMVAKFIDMPTVIVRTDFRAQSDSKAAPWNLMISFYPRTKTLLFDGMDFYQKRIPTYPTGDYKQMLEAGAEAGKKATEDLAEQISKALDEVASQPALLTGEQKIAVMDWALKMPGACFSEAWTPEQLAAWKAKSES